ncbi:nuclear transport factor 2 family protein [Streptomonospora wellingtoniae]|uniref:Nuclear transport factor 2 family protein n=1 Tax=Streptomonospora wellingtoniae TaxID=3075544 RepID=A0ABU2KPR1_9ACTN|nr:nuclear transport factor 2 family protein [Streptomonospora sp. DSM 45055]MDT0301266.1 nuclear transport factor 2 family protein [Streptomonospora sp. DSM 45055]
MDAAANRELLEKAYAALAEGDTGPWAACLHEDVVWTVIGTSPWSGTYNGRQAVLTELLGPLQAQLAPDAKVTPRAFTAEGDRVVVEAAGPGNRTATGRAYENEYCWVFRMEKGRAVQVKEYSDTELMAAVLGAPGEPPPA